jgi:hypothetical protein
MAEIGSRSEGFPLRIQPQPSKADDEKSTEEPHSSEIGLLVL